MSVGLRGEPVPHLDIIYEEQEAPKGVVYYTLDDQRELANLSGYLRCCCNQSLYNLFKLCQEQRNMLLLVKYLKDPLIH